LLKKVAGAFITKVIVAILNLLALLISSHYMGAETRGFINLFILNLSIIHGINEVYTGYTLVYFIPRMIFRKLYTYGLIWLLIVSVIVTSIIVLFQMQMWHIAMHLFAIAVLLSIHSFHLVILLAHERIKAFNFLNFLQAFVLIVSLAIQVFILKEKDSFAYIIALYSAYGIPALISSIMIFKLTGQNNGHTAFNSVAIIRNGFYNQLAAIAHVFSNRINFYLLGSNVLVGVFGNASTLSESIWLISSSVSPIVLSRIANTYDVQAESVNVWLMAKLCFLLSLAASVVLWLIPNSWFIQLMGKDFSEVKWLMLHLSSGVLCISFSTIISHFYAGIGRQKLLLLANLSGFLIGIVASWFLVKPFDLLGACYASNLSYITAFLILLFCFMRAYQFSWKDLFSLNIKGLRS
jgi:O-antigen/teichoic acid export membrane protein